MEKSVIFVGVNLDNVSATVAFSDHTERQYKVRYTKTGRRYLKVCGKIIYDWNGKAI